MTTTHSPDRALVGGAIVVGVIVVAAGIAALAGSGPTTYQPGSPEATAQAYVQAVLDDDTAAIQSLVIDSSCDVGPRYFGDEPIRVTLVGTDIVGDTATVRIDVTHGTSDPIFGGGWDENSQINLRQVDGSWAVDGDSWPFWCPPVKP